MKTLLSFFFIATLISANAQSNQKGVIYGVDHQYELTAPAGWELSTKKGIKLGMMGVFYPEGVNWHKATTIMYTNSSHLTENQKSIEDLIAYDKKEFEKASPGIKIPHGHDLELEGGETAVIYKFTGGSADDHEAVAYIGEEHIVVLLVISANSEKELDENYDKFVELVKSFKWLGEDE